MPRTADHPRLPATTHRNAAGPAEEKNQHQSARGNHHRSPPQTSFKCRRIAELRRRGGGTVFTWGLGRAGALGHDALDAEGVCALPAAMCLRGAVTHAVQVACGADSTAVVTADGQLWTCGRGSRLGHGCKDVVPVPRRVAALARHIVLQVSVGDAHAGCILQSSRGSGSDSGGSDGHVAVTWGSGRRGALGYGDTRDRLVPDPSHPLRFPTPSQKPASSGESGTAAAPLRVRQIECAASTTAAIVDDGVDASRKGQLWTWGCNEHGVLGLGNDARQPWYAAPQQNPTLGCGDASTNGREREGERVSEGGCDTVHVVDVALGSVYAAAIDSHGQLWSWGYGGHGNLGHGDRRSTRVPRKVVLSQRGDNCDGDGTGGGGGNVVSQPAGGSMKGQRADASAILTVTQVACTIGQTGFKGPRYYPQRGRSTAACKNVPGSEGPHSAAIVNTPRLRGALATWGTCHKGVLADGVGGRKPQLGDRNDALVPRVVREGAPDDGERVVVDKDAETTAAAAAPFVQVVASSIHCLALDAAGRLFAFGCGSGGRCGVEVRSHAVACMRNRACQRSDGVLPLLLQCSPFSQACMAVVQE